MGFTEEQKDYIIELNLLTNGHVQKSVDLFQAKFGFKISNTTIRLK